MDIYTALSALGASVKAAKDYFEGNREAQAKIGELGLQIMDVQQRAMEMTDQIRELKVRLQEAEEKQRLNDAVFFQNEACWRKDKEGQEKGPYCHLCWAKEKRLIHLDYIPSDEERRPGFDPYMLLEEEGEMHGSWMCRSCKGGYRQGWKKETSKPKPPPNISKRPSRW